MSGSRWWVLAGLCLFCCARARDQPATGGVLVRWTGADTGQLRIPASATWCPTDSVLEILGRSGDSGFALALFPPTQVRPGTYPIHPPVVDSARPRAGVALRWYGKTLIVGYFGLSGVVTVTTGSPLGGRVDATLKSVVDGRQLKLSGAFRDLLVTPEQGACGHAVSAGPPSGLR